MITMLVAHSSEKGCQDLEDFRKRVLSILPG